MSSAPSAAPAAPATPPASKHAVPEQEPQLVESMDTRPVAAESPREMTPGERVLKITEATKALRAVSDSVGRGVDRSKDIDALETKMVQDALTLRRGGKAGSPRLLNHID